MIDISIIMPVYNSENTLDNTINSIIRQTIKKESMELLIIDDGSTDNSQKICKKYSKKYSNIKYYKIENAGVSNARNIGLTKAKGKYICFIDSDDTYEENALEKLLKEIVKNKSDLIIAGYNRINLKSRKKIKKVPFENEYLKANFNILIENCQNNNLFNQLWNKIFVSKIINENNLKFDTTISLGEDYKFIIEYITYCKKINTINSVVYNYMNTTNGLNMKYRKDRIFINMENLYNLEKIYLENGYDLKYINNAYFKTLISGICNIYENPNKKEIKNEIEKLYLSEKIINTLKSKKNIKFRIVLYLIRHRMSIIIFIIAKILNFYKKIYKKIKLGY